MQEERLVSSPPTDLVVQKRQAALQFEAEAKRRIKEYKPTRVKESYLDLLREFSQIYFKGTARYDDLSLQEQKVVAKICLRQSLKTSLIVSSSITAGFVTFVSMMAKTTGDMVGLSILGLMMAGITVAGIELIYEVNDRLHLYQRIQFIWQHFYLKRKKLSPFQENQSSVKSA